MRPTTVAEALRDCELLWQWLAEYPEKTKFDGVEAVLDYTPESMCPACDYAVRNCKGNDFLCESCPIDAWQGTMRTCTRDGSPYRKWFLEYDRDLAKSSRDSALQIVALVRASKGYAA